MQEFSKNDTICAIATPLGPGGVGMVRISGPKASEILKKIWRGGKNIENLEVRKLYLGRLVDLDGSILDRVMAVFMAEPGTYTGEDVVELSCHGSPIVLKKIVELCVKSGARPAGPGEFTRRAFLAGKIDLAEAEAVADLISATSERAASLATQQLNGRLSKEVIGIGEDLANLRAEVEASIDFPEEDIDVPGRKLMADAISKLKTRVEKLLSTFDEGRQVREGVRVAIVGRPNAGKSSIFNAIIGQDRALVHHTPGTTRDVVEESASFGGLSFRFKDTAGLRESECEVEALGIDRSRAEIDAADIVLAVFDGSLKFDDADKALLDGLDQKKTIIVINKCDLIPGTCTFPEVRVPGISAPQIAASAKTGEKITYIIDALISHVSQDKSVGDGAIITSQRHKKLLDDALVGLKNSEAAITSKAELECLASDLNLVQDSLGAITGAYTTDDLLNKIFSKFCIGK